MRHSKKSGFALISVITLLVVLMALIAAYFMLTRIELKTTKASQDQTSGFYAAEAGLNLRAEEIRQTFVGYNRPTGTSPSTNHPCQGGDLGSGDFACKAYTLNGRKVWTYVIEDPNNPTLIRIPPGESFQNLNAQEYRYSVFSTAYGPEGEPEAILEMRFKSRLVPLFQFAIFYRNDLEFNHTAPMTLNGPVHSNGDIYFDAGGGATLTVRGQVTTAGSIWRGDKSRQDCHGTVQITTGASLRALPCNGDTLRQVPDSELTPWGSWIQTHIRPLTVPPPGAISPPWSPSGGGLYWRQADLRAVLVLDNNQNPQRIELRDRSNNPLPFNLTSNCPTAFTTSSSFYNNRERTYIRMLDVDVRAVLDCIHANRNTLGFDINDTTDGGLVFYFTVQGPNSNGLNNYGVRLRNGAVLASTDPTAPQIRGLTVVTDQALYVQGDYNRTNWKPAAFISDSLNALSNNWANTENYPVSGNAPGCGATLSGDQKSDPVCRNRTGATPTPPNQDNWTDTSRWLPQATTTTINAAVLTGASITPTQGGQGGGGVHNIFRFHEHWGGNTQNCCNGQVTYSVARFNYLGSIVSLWQPQHVNGPFFVGPPWYQPPVRNIQFDQRFNDYANLPPLTPRFVYLRQELFEREFEQR